MLKPAIALYLGETYASLGLFDRASKDSAALLFEKSIFLPQVSLKNLAAQALVQFKSLAPECETPVQVFIVTKYFDRLKQFRLGGSVSQVVIKGFENSYTLHDTKKLSLAASQLIISIEPHKIDEEHLATELDRIKKINPDLNKVAISIPEDLMSSEEAQKIENFFIAKEMKVFRNPMGHNLDSLRKTLLNAGSEGTKEEITQVFIENFGEKTEVQYFTFDGFKKDFENCELFHGADNFLALSLKSQKISEAAYLDIEQLSHISQVSNNIWNSPWGDINITHFTHQNLGPHFFSELKLNHLSMLSYNSSNVQLEPGPILAGRAIKPLLLDLFYEKLSQNKFYQDLFPNINTPTLLSKIKNLFSTLEKSQKSDTLNVTIEDLQNDVLNTIELKTKLYNKLTKPVFCGPLAHLLAPDQKVLFSWPTEIKKMVITKL